MIEAEGGHFNPPTKLLQFNKMSRAMYIGYVLMLCAGIVVRDARLKYENCGLTMMLFTNCYENHNKVFSRPSLTSVEVSKRYSNQIRRF